jgi:beta-mannanase
MNGTWYPWSATVNGNTPDDFKRAYRHVHRVFDAEHADNVSWVFSIDTLAGGPPTPLSTLETYWPGHQYIDWVGLSGFNWGPESVYPSERSFLSTFQPSVDVVKQFDKPVMLSEVGTSAKSADPAGWLDSAMNDVRQMPAVKSLVFFNADTPDADFRLGAAARQTLEREGRARRFTRPLRLVPATP